MSRRTATPLVRRYRVVLTTLMFLLTGSFLLLRPSISTVRTHWVHTEPYTIHTTGCKIPYMSPFDESILEYIEEPKVKKCNGTSVLNKNRTHIWIKDNNKFDNLSCCYQSFHRPKYVEDVTSRAVDKRVTYNDCVYFYNSIIVYDEFVKVTCKSNSTEYVDYFLFAVGKENNVTYEDYNVLILGIDAISRLNFHRTMPKTVEYLKRIGAVELLGYNKVGDNTFPNLMPMLLGLKDSELKSTCLPFPDSTFDNCPFIWNRFKELGYMTALGEDNSNIGTFNFNRVGFIKKPTDYYLHTFMEEAEKAGNNKDYNTYLCTNDRYFYKILLDYISDLTKLKNKLFGFFWEITMSHDYLNYPKLMDDSYVELLNDLNENISERTILFLVSDHGIRWGGIRSTKQGRLEERLPFVFILTPKSFKDKYKVAYSNLIENSQRLTTPYDIHETLLDLASLSNIQDDNLSVRIKEKRDRGISLFLPIPDTRTCRTAGIDDHWCTCHRNVITSIVSSDAKNAASHVILHLNTLLEKYSSCAELVLDNIIYVSEVISGVVDFREFLVVVSVAPSGGLFEATLKKENDENNNEKWSVTGTVSRVNLYGNQSSCIDNNELKLYCYCE